MATINKALDGLVSQIKAGLAQFDTLKDTKVGVARGWPPKECLDQVSGGDETLISVVDTGFSRNVTRWKAADLAQVMTPAEVRATLSDDLMTITLSNGVIENDGIAVLFPRQQRATAVRAASGETLSSFAAKLAAAISADLSNYLTASAAGAVITLSDAMPGLQVNVGNVGVALPQIHRQYAVAQVSAWAGSEDDRDSLTEFLEPLLSQLQHDYGFNVEVYPNVLDAVRVIYEGSAVNDADKDRSLYRRDFRASLEYNIQGKEMLVEILAPLFTLQ